MTYCLLDVTVLKNVNTKLLLLPSFTFCKIKYTFIFSVNKINGFIIKAQFIESNEVKK